MLSISFSLLGKDCEEIVWFLRVYILSDIMEQDSEIVLEKEEENIYDLITGRIKFK